MQPRDGLGVAAAAQVCIPGSHKRNFLPPDNSDERLRGQSLWGDGVPEIDIYDGPPTVANLCPKAGSCIIFTEALRVRLKTAAPLPRCPLPPVHADRCMRRQHGVRKWEASYPRLTVFNRYVSQAQTGSAAASSRSLCVGRPGTLNGCQCDLAQKASWPEKYWGSRSQGPIDSQVLDSCAHMLSPELRQLQEPSGSADLAELPQGSWSTSGSAKL